MIITHEIFQSSKDFNRCGLHCVSPLAGKSALMVSLNIAMPDMGTGSNRTYMHTYIYTFIYVQCRYILGVVEKSFQLILSRLFMFLSITQVLPKIEIQLNSTRQK